MYLEHADADLYSAKLLLSPQGNPSNDEYILDIAAYHTQQSMEKYLKYVLHDLYGADETARSFKTHNILALILLTEAHTPYTVPQEIKDAAALVTSWESSTRYGVSPAAAQNTIADAISRCENLRADILRFQAERTGE